MKKEELSKKSLQLLKAIFSGDLKLPVSLAEEVVEIKGWLKAVLEEEQEKK